MTMHIKVIRTAEDHAEALTMIAELLKLDPAPESEAGEKLSLLTTLVMDYETSQFPETLPDPIDAIIFRMEQQHLKPADLIPYIGSRSKVSEVLSRKRPLTLSMIRSLEAGLGIPAKVLVKESDEFRNAEAVAWNRFPLKEMRKRGYFEGLATATADLKALMEAFFQPVGSPAHFFGKLRKSSYRSLRQMDKHALIVWATYVAKKARAIKHVSPFDHDVLSLDFMRELARLSVQDNGPLLARDFLRQNGVTLVIEPHFPQTYLDGAVIMDGTNVPIIGLTLRHDRVDNFWYTLMHELAHLQLHYHQNVNFFFDDLDSAGTEDGTEREADNFAGEALVPAGKWENSPARLIPSAIAAESLARDLGIHTAIVAGKMRHEIGRYVYLNSIISSAKVRQHFPEERWSR
jgi:HTH-type transcriptional regulator/antitoxin HigA